MRCLPPWASPHHGFANQTVTPCGESETSRRRVGLPGRVQQRFTGLMRRLATPAITPAIIAAALLLGACSAAPTGNQNTGASPVSSPRQAPATSSRATAPLGSAEAGSATLECTNYSDAQPPPADFQIVLGVVALPTSPRAAALGTTSVNDPDPSLRLFAKTGLFIKVGTPFELIVPDQPAGRLAIGWGPNSTPSRRVIVANCADGRHTGWLDYPGGYWLSAPACVPLIVRADGKDQLVHIGLGTPCPGQQPPPGPSDR